MFNCKAPVYIDVRATVGRPEANLKAIFDDITDFASMREAPHLIHPTAVMIHEPDDEGFPGCWLFDLVFGGPGCHYHTEFVYEIATGNIDEVAD